MGRTFLQKGFGVQRTENVRLWAHILEHCAAMHFCNTIKVLLQAHTDALSLRLYAHNCEAHLASLIVMIFDKGVRNSTLCT